ncbi:ECF transporter S component [Xylanivirga thermophila]|uniref:ECF transporter S component n=1 Tax=Xylanivirga thermophila TaxID=2496273 RepID=UPI00101E04DD|nr:ECF transporter S component [Xylanivirga thermophila]
MNKTSNLVKASFFLALGIIIPYIFHLAGIGGSILLPMHIPVLLCGFLLGTRYGLIVGFITPFLNSLLTGMPPIYPMALAMAFELATYGAISGYTYKSKHLNVYLSLIIAMLAGRAVYGIVNYILLATKGEEFLFKAFLVSSFVKPIWGIIIQIAIIPFIVKMLEKNKEPANLNG